MKTLRFLTAGWPTCAFASLGSFAVGTIGEKPVLFQKSDDFVLVSNPKTPKYPSMRIVFKEDLTIGLREGDEEGLFFKNGKAYALEMTEEEYRFVKRYSLEIKEN